MGYLRYDTAAFAFDDRSLAHLRTVILSKLNLQESLVFTWVDGERQHSLWLHPAIPLHFEFNEGVPLDLNPAWVEQLLSLANSPGGLRLSEEPQSE